MGRDVVNYEMDVRAWRSPFEPDYIYSLGENAFTKWRFYDADPQMLKLASEVRDSTSHEPTHTPSPRAASDRMEHVDQMRFEILLGLPLLSHLSLCAPISLSALPALSPLSAHSPLLRRPMPRAVDSSLSGIAGSASRGRQSARRAHRLWLDLPLRKAEGGDAPARLARDRLPRLCRDGECWGRADLPCVWRKVPLTKSPERSLHGGCELRL